MQEQEIANSAVRAVLFVPIDGILGQLSSKQLGFLAFSLCSIILLVFGYKKLKAVFYQPLDYLMDTMNQIKSGQLEAKVQFPYAETEFNEISDTFNSMITYIRQLKNETYEKEIHLQQVQLEYYQLQIKPHFYLNCLKGIYGMAESVQLEQMKKTILYLSQHLRNILKKDSMVVNLQQELLSVENYIQLQNMMQFVKIHLDMDCPEELKGIEIPAISLLSFAENSIKYGLTACSPLSIQLKISKNISDENTYLLIHMQDNGPGFSDESLSQLNFPEQAAQNSQAAPSIGIYNVMQRYQLFFGKEHVWFGFSNQKGASIDIFIHLLKEGERN